MKRIYIILGLICLLFSGCFKDDGNYDYRDINEVQITGLPEEMKIYYRNVDTLKASPAVEGNLDEGDQSRYYYQWQAVSKGQTGTTTSSYIIGTEKELNYFMVLPDAEYDVYCCVKDTLTRVTWKSSFPIKVTTELNSGWLVLSEVNNACKLDLISLSGKESKVIRDVFAELPVLKGPKRLQSVFNMYTEGVGAPRYYLMSESGCYKLNVSDYGWDEALNIRYEMMEYPEGLVSEFRGAGMGWELLIANKAVYGANAMGVASPFGLPANYITGTEDYFDVAETAAYNMGYSAYMPKKVLYDMTNRRFVQLASSYRSCELITAAETKFTWNTGKDFVYSTTTPFAKSTTYTILEEPDSHKRFIYIMSLSSGITQSNMVDLSAATDIEKAKCFAVYPSLNWLFYAVDNLVYLFDMNKNLTTPIRLTNETITLLKFNIFTEVNVNPTIQAQLIVGSVDNSGPALNGRLRFYTVPTSWSLEPFEEPVPYDYFGKPVDVMYTTK